MPIRLPPSRRPYSAHRRAGPERAGECPLEDQCGSGAIIRRPDFGQPPAAVHGRLACMPAPRLNSCKRARTTIFSDVIFAFYAVHQVWVGTSKSSETIVHHYPKYADTGRKKTARRCGRFYRISGLPQTRS
jgi:hypothetical protein